MLEEVCKRIQHCCATLRRSQNKRNVGSCWLKTLLANKFASVWTQSKELRRDESARLPPMWPGFKSWRRCHNVSWVHSGGFSLGSPLFPSPQKPTSQNSNSTKNQVDEEPLCRCATSKSLFIYFIEVFIYLFNISWPSSFSGCQFVLFSVLRHSAVHSAIVFLPLVWLRSRREKCKNRSVFWVSAECEWKRYLPTVVSSNTFTVNYLFFSKAVLKKFNYIKICLYLKLKRLRRDRALYKLRKERIYNGWLR